MSSSLDIYTKNHIYLCCTDFVVDEKRIYFSNRTCNGLVIVDRATRTVESMMPFIKEELNAKELHFKCCKWGNKIYFFPWRANLIHVYNMENGEQEAYELKDGCGMVRNYHIWKDKIYLLPGNSGMGLWTFSAAGQLEREIWWDVSCDDSYFIHGSMDEQHVFSLKVISRYLTITNLETRSVRTYNLPDNQVFRVTYDGQDFWYISYDNTDVVRWNPIRGEISRYHFPVWDKCHISGMSYVDIYAEGQRIYVVSGNGEGLFALDQENGELNRIFEVPEFPKIYSAVEKTPFFTHLEDKLVWGFRGVNRAVAVNLNTMEGKLYKDVIALDEKVQDYFNRVLVKDAPLFIEDSDWSLEKYLKYCEDSVYKGF